MKAPTEKHLEDWIVANLDRFGDAVEAGFIPEEYTEHWPRLDDGCVIAAFIDRLLKRQFRLPSGIADLIGVAQRRISVVEIKKGPVTYETIGQCLRYLYDVHEIHYWTAFEALSADHPDHQQYYFPPQHDFEISEYPKGVIGGIVVGHGMVDRNVPLVGAVANIAVVTYDFDGTNYRFKHEMIANPAPVDVYKQYAYGAIGDALRFAYRAEAQARRASEANDE